MSAVAIFVQIVVGVRKAKIREMLISGATPKAVMVTAAGM
jgi:hypothetical protein